MIAIDRLISRVVSMKNPTCVGLDTTIDMIPESLLEYHTKYADAPFTPTMIEEIAEAIFSFNKKIIDTICDIVPVVKINIAMYEKFGSYGINTYIKTIQHARDNGMVVIGDVKRGDIGNTVESYSDAHLGRVTIGDRKVAIYDTDFITVNPYMGFDTIHPFLDDCKTYEKGIFILAKTSNPGSIDIQDRITLNDDASVGAIGTSWIPLHVKVCKYIESYGEEFVSKEYPNFTSVGAVVGFNHSTSLGSLRDNFPNVFFLVPGYGAQGGTAKDVAKAFRKEDKLGAIVNSSRGIIASHKKDPNSSWIDCIRNATITMRDELREAIGL